MDDLKKLWYVCLVWFLWNPQQSYAQKFPFQLIGIEDGLPQSVVYDIFQDSRSYMWFATQDGVARYDGKEFVYFSLNQGLSDNMARSINEDSKGRIYVCTDHGLNILSPQTDGNYNVSVLFPDVSIRDIAFETDSTFWIASIGGGFFQSDFEGTIRNVINKDTGLLSERVYAVEVQENGAVLAATDHGFVVRSKKGLLTIFTTKDGLKSNRLRTLLTAPNGVYIGGYEGEISIYKNGSIEKPPYLREVLPIKINEFFREENGALWSATDGGGVLVFSPSGWTKIGREEGLLNTSIQCVLKDSEGNFWLGTWGSGVYKLRYTNVRLYDMDSGLPENNVISISGDRKQHLWMGTNNYGLLAFKNGKIIQAYSTQNSDLESNRIFDLEWSENGVYIGTDEGVQILDKNRFSSLNQRYSLPRFSARSILYHKKVLYVGTFGTGLYIKKNDRISHITSLEGLPNDSIFSMTYGRNNTVWVGTDGGLAQLKNNTVSKVLTIEDGLVSNRISALFTAKDSSIWIGTYKGGLSHLTKDTVVNYTTENGLSHNLITFIRQTDDGVIVIGTKEGVTLFKPNGTFDYLSSKRGLSSKETNQNAIHQQGSVFWIGTVNGVTRLDLSVTPEDIDQIPTYLISTKIYGSEPIGFEQRTLWYNQNYLTFEYHGVNFTHPEDLTYRYRLIGFDTTWKNTTHRSVQYTNLDPGSYSFQVKAVGLGHRNLSDAAIFEFSIIPPFWATWPFIVSAISVLILLVVTGIRRKGQKLKELNERLELTVKDRTEALHKSEQLFRLISENAGDLICVTTRDSTAIYISPSMRPLLGYDPQEFIGKPISSLSSKKDQIRINKAVTNIRSAPSNTLSIETQLKHKNGTWIYFVITLTPVGDEKQEEEQFVLVAHDISEQKSTEKVLVQSKLEAEAANVAKSRFLASMSHELRTPLNAILGFAQIMVGSSQLTGKFKDYVRVMHNSGEHLLSMINDILDLSKIEAGRMEVKNMSAVLVDFLFDLESMMMIQARKKELALSFSIDPSLPKAIKLDFNKLRQILINLIGNAIKYTPSGSVKVECTFVEPSRFKCSVIDTGDGISKEQMAKIFEAFHQVGEDSLTKGTGLGLTISLKLSELMGGKLSAHSQIGEGSTFTLEVPFTKVDESEVSVITQKNHSNIIIPDEKKCVFVVDDIEENRTFIKEFLCNKGFEVYDFEGADAMIQALEKTVPSLIITDLVMPNMTGKELLRWLKDNSRYRQIPVLAITASIFEETREDMVQFGFDEFLHKPIVLNELFALVVELLNLTSNDSPSGIVDSEVKEWERIQTEIESLTEKERISLAEATELMDLEALQALSTTMSTETTLIKRLNEALDEKNFRFILQLDELLNEK